MKILLITSIFPPDIGGPAILTEKLASIFNQKKIFVKVLCLSDSKSFEKLEFPVIRVLRKQPRIIRYFVYFLKLLKTVPFTDMIYCLSASPGMAFFPLILSKIFRKKFIIRPGGDFLWERDTERERTELSLKEYYERGEFKKRQFSYFLLNYVFKNADLIVFPTHFLKNLYLNSYDIKKEKTEFIDYPFPEVKNDFLKTIQRPKQILFAGRLIKFKNLSRLVKAFSEIRAEGVILKIIGAGSEKENLKTQIENLHLENKVIIKDPLSHSLLLEEIKKSYLTIVPSIFEPGSFFGLESIKLKTPILFTREAGIYEKFKDDLIFINPFDIKDIKEKIEFLLNENNWQNYFQRISRIKTERNWQDVASEHLNIFKKLTKKGVLFIGVTNYNFLKPESLAHLETKFLGLSNEFEVFSLARGKPFHKKIWNSEFYLLERGVFYWPLAFFIAFYLCLSKKIDTIVAQSCLMEGFVGSVLKFIFKKELIVEIHGDWVEGPFLSRKRKLEFLDRKVVPFLSKISFKSADKIRVVAKYLMEKAKEIIPQKPFFLFPTFTNLDMFFEEEDVGSNNFILFVGQLEKVKGIEYLIRAFSKIAKEFLDFKLIIVGEGSEKESLLALASSEGILEKVDFRGKLSLKETKDIMKNCYCLVLPSLSEGLPRVLMEAMTLKKPVIASNAGGMLDIIKDCYNGFIFKVGDSSELASKLKILLGNRELAREMGQRGRKLAESDFSNEKYLLNFINIINA